MIIITMFSDVLASSPFLQLQV